MSAQRPLIYILSCIGGFDERLLMNYERFAVVRDTTHCPNF